MSERVVYVKNGCPYCNKLKDDLDREGQKYELKNVSRDKAALKEAKTKYGADRVPVLVEGDKVTVGYKGGGG